MFDTSGYPSLSKADVKGITPYEIEAMAGKGYGEEAFVWRQMMMGSLSGVEEETLFDLLLSTAKGPTADKSMRLTEQNIGPNKSHFIPYILEMKEDVINANAFVIESAQANPNAGSTVDGITYRDNSWEITITNTGSEYGSNLPNIEDFFLPGESAIITHQSDTGSLLKPVMWVEKAISADAGGVHKAKIYLHAPYTDAEWALLTSDEQAIYQPGAGAVVICGSNSVSDYEPWAHNQPANISRRVHAYWPQTYRFTRTWDDEFEKYLNYIQEGKVNFYLEKFRTLPMAEQNKRMYAAYRRKWFNSMFYGQPKTQGQSVEDYQTSLAKVYDPRNAGSFIHYKSENVGIRGQLEACNRVIDYKGGRLNFNTLAELLYQLARHRTTKKGMTVEDIDCFTDRHNAARIESLMMDYYRRKYNVTAEVKFVKDEPLRIETGSKTHRTLWVKRSYELPEFNLVLHVYVVKAFGDERLHYPTNSRHLSNRLWFLDFSDLQIGIQATASRRSKTPDLETDPDFKDIIKANITHYELESVTCVPMVHNEDCNLMVENFSDACPLFTANPCSAQESSTSVSVSA